MDENVLESRDGQTVEVVGKRDGMTDGRRREASGEEKELQCRAVT